MRDKQREETRRRLYTAALEVFRADGFLHCRIDEIADRADVSRATFYFHFPTKEVVLLEFMDSAEASILERFRAQPPPEGLADFIAALAHQLADFWQDELRLLADVAAVWLRHNGTDRYPSRLRAVLVERFGAEPELLGASGMTAEALADVYLVNAMAAMMAWALAPAHGNLETALKGVSQLFLYGAMPRPGGPNVTNGHQPAHTPLPPLAPPGPAPAVTS